MKILYERMRYLIEDVTIKIQQLESGDVFMPLKGHSEWIESIKRDMGQRDDAQLQSLIGLYRDKLHTYTELLKSKKTDVQDILEAKDKTVRALNSYGAQLKDKK